MAAIVNHRTSTAGSGLSLAAPAIVLAVVLGCIPLAFVVVYSLLTPASFGGVEWVASANAYRSLLFRKDLFSEELVFSPDHLMIFGRSVLLALATTVLCFAVGFPTAAYMASRSPRARKWWVLAITIPFWTSLLVRTLALMLIIGDQGLINGLLIRSGLINAPVAMLYTDFAVLLGLLYSFLPFMVLPLLSSLEKLDPRLLEAGADLYASRWRIALQIVLPNIRPGIAAGCLLVFVPALGSYVVPLILGGGRSMMAGDLIALQFGTSRNWPLGSAESVVLVLFVALAFALSNLVRRRAA
ncbi:ABC transporter permease [Shinella curvata]|uniref:ABC transporter permease n=1 Tax=Shinella curvata TaxID=1817964 RepID=A0ABT8X9X6_9HYPH|nr:ABC transporter permease [Shinella curvata]MCJ8055152.1 ABC transporter permease [Shinella curvata]MDO6120452.1 ABC transporter permease [Shinella curvata]